MTLAVDPSLTSVTLTSRDKSLGRSEKGKLVRCSHDPWFSWSVVLMIWNDETRDPRTKSGWSRTERFGPGPAKFRNVGPDQDRTNFSNLGPARNRNNMILKISDRFGQSVDSWTRLFQSEIFRPAVRSSICIVVPFLMIITMIKSS